MKHVSLIFLTVFASAQLAQACSSYRSNKKARTQPAPVASPVVQTARPATVAPWARLIKPAVVASPVVPGQVYKDLKPVIVAPLVLPIVLPQVVPAASPASSVSSTPRSGSSSPIPFIKAYTIEEQKKSALIREELKENLALKPLGSKRTEDEQFKLLSLIIGAHNQGRSSLDLMVDHHKMELEKAQ